MIYVLTFFVDFHKSSIFKELTCGNLVVVLGLKSINIMHRFHISSKQYEETQGLEKVGVLT
jgi:hypothetical protein